MNLVRVTPELRNHIRAALENPFRFERTERFAMQQVLDGTELHSDVEQVFLDTAQDALSRQKRWAHPLPVRQSEQAA